MNYWIEWEPKQPGELTQILESHLMNPQTRKWRTKLRIFYVVFKENKYMDTNA